MRLAPIAAGILAASLALCGCAQADMRSDARLTTDDLAAEASSVTNESATEASAAPASWTSRARSCTPSTSVSAVR